MMDTLSAVPRDKAASSREARRLRLTAEMERPGSQGDGIAPRELSIDAPPGHGDGGDFAAWGAAAPWPNDRCRPGEALTIGRPDDVIPSRPLHLAAEG